MNLKVQRTVRAQPWKTVGRGLALALLLLFLCSLNRPLWAEAPSADPGGLFVLDDLLFFFAEDGSYGLNGLWQTDGTSEGTVRFRETSRGSNLLDPGDIPLYMVKVGDTLLLFLTNRDRVSRELLLANGSNPPERVELPWHQFDREQIVVVGTDRIFFVVEDLGDRELWTSDGTAAGTGQVVDINPNGSDGVDELTPVGDLLFFEAQDGTGGELWKSDGTPEGTAMVADIHPQSTSSPSDLTNFNGVLYFRATDGVNGAELWRSDGTAADTVPVADIQPGVGGSSPNNLTVVGNWLFFTADDGVHGRELWMTDGSTTSLVRNIADGDTFNFSGGDLTASGDLLFFTVNDESTGTELWVSDGSAEGTTLVADIRPGPDGGLGAGKELTAGADGDLFFVADDGVHGRELWRYHAATASAAMVRDIGPGSADGIPNRPRNAASGGKLTWFEGQLYFTADDGSSGVELWRSNGTQASTSLVKDLYSGSEPVLLTAAGDGAIPATCAAGGPLVYFRAYDSEAGREPWVSDGSIAGTRRLADINPGRTGSLPHDFVTAGALTFFVADDGTHGEELWVTDGTSTGTRLVKDIVPGEESPYLDYLTPFQTRLLFVADSAETGRELWISDGTEGGTVLLADIQPGPASSSISGLLALDDVVLFGADDDVHGRELWKTDGTPEGTLQVRDIRPGSRAGNPDELVRMGDRIYFTADDGATGQELWASDGTQSGTQLVKDIVPGPGASHPDHLIATDTFLFFDKNSSQGESGLWRSDGTEEGTVLLHLAHPDEGHFIIYEAAATSDWIAFSYGTPETGQEMWRSDGTAEGTFLLRDINPGPISSRVSRPRLDSTGYSDDHLPTTVGDHIYFAAWSPQMGTALWRTDGTTGGTAPALDLVPGAGDATPYPILGMGESLWFASRDPETGGQELFCHQIASGETVRLTGPRLAEESLFLPLLMK